MLEQYFEKTIHNQKISIKGISKLIPHYQKWHILLCIQKYALVKAEIIPIPTLFSNAQFLNIVIIDRHCSRLYNNTKKWLAYFLQCHQSYKL